jgi:hypothetical protein
MIEIKPAEIPEYLRGKNFIQNYQILLLSDVHCQTVALRIFENIQVCLEFRFCLAHEMTHVCVQQNVNHLEFPASRKTE